MSTTDVPTRADLRAARLADTPLTSALKLIKSLVVDANARGVTRIPCIQIFTDGIYTAPTGDTVTLAQVAAAIRLIPDGPTVINDESGVFFGLDWS